MEIMGTNSTDDGNRYHLLLTFAFFVTTVVFFVAWSEELDSSALAHAKISRLSKENERITGQLRALEDELQELRRRPIPGRISESAARISEAAAKIAEASRAQRPGEDQEAGADGASPATDQWRIEEFFVDSQVRHIERYVVLNEQQRAELKKYFSELGPRVERLGRNRLGRDSRNEEQAKRLSEILGTELYTKYEEQANADAERVRTEFMQARALLLTRKLNLSPGTELKIEEAMRQSRDEALAELNAASSASVEGSVPLSQHVSEAERFTQRQRELLREKLRPLLSDEQFNAFIEDQESRAGGSPW